MAFNPLNHSSSKSANILVFPAVCYANQGNVFDFLQTSVVFEKFTFKILSYLWNGEYE